MMTDVPSQTAQNSCQIQENLAVGSRGPEVDCLQTELIKEGLLSISVPTGYFGPLTKAAVAKWQMQNSVYSSGFFGELSLKAWNGSMMPHMSNQNSTSSVGMEMDKRYDVPVGTSSPTIALQVFNDSESGYNLHFITTNFTFAPEHVGGADVMGEGHIHVMVDGQMINRSYSDWYHIDPLSPGTHVITAELETNAHEDYFVNGMQVAASTTITVSEASSSMPMMSQ